MACKKYYFDLDYYGVGFYEEEVATECQQGGAVEADGVVSILEELNHLNAVSDHNYNREERKNGTLGNPHDPQHGEQGSVSRKPSRYCRKQYKFTAQQLYELDRVFEETQYPDALKRKELAELINVEECTVKIWFNNRRAKLRKHHRALMRKNAQSAKQNRYSLKILKETKSVIVLQEPLKDGAFASKLHAGHPNWQ